MLEENSYPLINININNFIEECGDNKEALKQMFNYYKNSYYKKQHNLIGYNKLNEHFMDTITIMGNKEYYITKIKYNKKELLNKICRILNLMDKNITKEKLLKQLDKLKEIKTEESLKETFPLIYNDYLEGNKIYKNFDSIKDFAPYMKEKEREEALKEAYKLEKYYYSCGIRFSIEHFIKEQSKLYQNMINHLDDLSNFIDKTNITHIIEYVDKDKTKFYLANKFLEECFITKDQEKLSIYLSLIDKYLNQVKNTNLVIHNEYGGSTTFKDFLAIYRNFTNHDKLITNWELIPKGTKTNTNINNDHRLIKNSKNLEKYLDLNNKKLKLYERSPYIGKAKGLCLNEGYTAYFYENGEILLDRIADSNDNLSTGYGNAIYNLNSDNFIELSSKDKTTLREEDLCPYFYHSGYWEKRIQNIIETPPTESTITKSNNLIKILKTTH